MLGVFCVIWLLIVVDAGGPGRDVRAAVAGSLGKEEDEDEDIECRMSANWHRRGIIYTIRSSCFFFHYVLLFAAAYPLSHLPLRYIDTYYKRYSAAAIDCRHVRLA